MKEHSRLGGKPPQRGHCAIVLAKKIDDNLYLSQDHSTFFGMGMLQDVSESFLVDVHHTSFQSFLLNFPYDIYINTSTLFLYLHISISMHALEEILYYFHMLSNVMCYMP